MLGQVLKAAKRCYHSLQTRFPRAPASAIAFPLSMRISVKVISGFGERDQGRKVVLRGQEIVA
jgi:hypothetical protein